MSLIIFETYRVVKKPGTASFTDNNTLYEADLAYDLLRNSKFQIQVHVDNKVVGTMHYPINSFRLVFSINEVVKAYTEFVRPLHSTVFLRAVGQSVKAWISVKLSNSSDGFEEVFPASRYIKGGYGSWSNVPNFNFEHARKWFFTWHRSGKKVGEHEKRWLLYCHPINLHASMEINISYDDRTNFQYTERLNDVLIGSSNIYELYYLASGVENLNLRRHHPDKQIVSYNIIIRNTLTNARLAQYFYAIDMRPSYNAFVVYYRNSLGGWDDIRLLGEWSEHAEYERRGYDRSMKWNDAKLRGETPWYFVEERKKWSANTGTLLPEDMDAFRDFMRSKEMAILVKDKWVPVRVVNSTFDGKNTREPLPSVHIEFEAEFKNENYTPENLTWENL